MRVCVCVCITLSRLLRYTFFFCAINKFYLRGSAITRYRVLLPATHFSLPLPFLTAHTANGHLTIANLNHATAKSHDDPPPALAH